MKQFELRKFEAIPELDNKNAVQVQGRFDLDKFAEDIMKHTEGRIRENFQALRDGVKVKLDEAWDKYQQGLEALRVNTDPQVDIEFTKEMAWDNYEQKVKVIVEEMERQLSIK